MTAGGGCQGRPPPVLVRLDARAVGEAAWRLGAGRARKEDPVLAEAGVIMHAKPGEVVHAGDPLLELHTDDAGRFERALTAIESAYTIGVDFATQPLIIERIAAD